MSKQATLILNKVRENIKKSAEDAVKEKLVAIADTAVTYSPVDTGAYVTSHSFKTNTSSRGRGKSSANKPRNQNPETKRQEGFDNLMDDINSLDLSELNKITLRNDSPHAQDVEYGKRWPKTDGYLVYAKVRNLHG